MYQGTLGLLAKTYELCVTDADDATELPESHLIPICLIRSLVCSKQSHCHVMVVSCWKINLFSSFILSLL